MNTIGITTDVIRSCNYHKTNQTLNVTTKDGFVYQYFEVPEKTINEFIETDKPGLYYANNIRKKFRRLFKTYDFSMML